MPELAKKAEAIGLHSFWVNDRVVYENVEPLTALTAAAAVTLRIKVGTCVLLAAVRQPVVLAKTLASIDFLSGGRLIAGIGLGGRQDDFIASGVPFEKRGARLSEVVRLLRRLLSGEQVTHSGRFYQLENVAIGPKPVQVPRPPIWLGGGAEGALRRAAELADGYICSTSSLPRFPAIWEKIQEYAVQKGRDPNQIEKAGLNFLVIDNDTKSAIAACERYFQHVYGNVPEGAEANMVLGPPSACAERIRSIIEKGVHTLILGLIVPDLRQLDLLGERILPAI